MDATVTGALIAGGAALIGFGASAVSTRATLHASRAAALDQRLWDARSELYLRLLDIALGYKGSDLGDARQLCVALAKLEAQILAYASDAVVDKFQEANWLLDTHLVDSGEEFQGDSVPKGFGPYETAEAYVLGRFHTNLEALKNMIREEFLGRLKEPRFIRRARKRQRRKLRVW